MKRVGVLVLVLGLVSRVAAADPGSLAGIEAQEPASDHAFLLPTALTIPVGTIDVSGQILRDTSVLGQATIGLTETTEVSLLGGATYGGNADYLKDPHELTYGVGVTQQLYRNRRIAIALVASATQVKVEYEPTYYTSLAGGGVVTGCVDDACRVRLSGSVRGLDSMWSNNREPADATLELGASASVTLGPARLMAEVSHHDNFTTVLGGVRFTERHYAFDAGIGDQYFDSGAGTYATRVWVLRLTVRP